MFSLHSSPHQGQPSHPNSPLSVLLAWQKQNWVFPRSPSPIWLLSSSKGEVSAKLLPLPNSYQTCLPTKKKPKMNFPGQWQSPNIRTDLFPGVTEWRQDAKLLSHIPLPLGKTIKSVFIVKEKAAIPRRSKILCATTISLSSQMLKEHWSSLVLYFSPCSKG